MSKISLSKVLNPEQAVVAERELIDRVISASENFILNVYEEKIAEELTRLDKWRFWKQVRVQFESSLAEAIHNNFDKISIIADIDGHIEKNIKRKEDFDKLISEEYLRQEKDHKEKTEASKKKSSKLRGEIKSLNDQIKSLEQKKEHLESLLALKYGDFEGVKFPDPPSAVIKPSKNGQGVPDAPGIYFFKFHGSVMYVGQSVKLSRRATTRHEKYRQGYQLSFVAIKEEDLNHAEAFYIALFNPPLNFNGNNRFIQ